VTWSTSNANVATVSNGTVSYVGVGNATITVTTQDGGKTATIGVNVSSSAVSVTGVSLNPTSLSGVIGGSGSLTATVSPSNATNQAITWSTSNANVATVSNGTVSYVGVGNATITVTTQDGGKTANCTVVVDDIPDGVESIENETLFVWGAGNALHIKSPHKDGTMYVYSFAGHIVKVVSYHIGDNTIYLPLGQYVVKTGEETTKVIIR
jgi:uncharacterized protein YjdB